MEALANTFTVALSIDFLDAFARIPRAQQMKVQRFVSTFRRNPTLPSINYEKISSFKDQNLRTVRIDDAYRAIVLRPSQGNVYALLWVDHHDRAMAWAEHKKVVVHPETGSLQIFTVQESLAEPAPAAVVPVPAPLFASLGEKSLLRLAVPEELLGDVLQVRNQAELAALESRLPQEAYEALFFLSEGESFEKVAALYEYRKTAPGAAPVDTTNFVEALQKPDSKQRFLVIDSEASAQLVETILNAPLEKWRVFLHPAQRQLVESYRRGPTRVLGGAGTGKTVVAMHRAAHLVKKVFTKPEDRILFTTFTRNLSADIQQNLSLLLPPELLRRVEVVHLDKWVTDVLRRHGYKFQIGYFKGYQAGELESLWAQALALKPSEYHFPDRFYREEWEQVVQRAGCETLDAYWLAPRPGRGTRLGRQQRRAVWAVFAEYRNLLAARSLREQADALRDARSLLETQKTILPYRAILVDEAQDMSVDAFRLLRSAVPRGDNDLFIVGDGHQRIYPNQTSLRQAGIDIVGRSSHLRLNYRTTEEIRSYAVRVLEGVAADDLDEGPDNNDGYRSLMHGASPRVVECKSFQDELRTICEFLQTEERALSHTCLVARTESLLVQYQKELESRGIATYRIKRSEPDATQAPGLRLATMHRVKGLEFERVIIAGANREVIPLRDALASEDHALRAESEQRERSLLYVALTRAKREVLITSFGEPSLWIFAKTTK